VARSNDGETIFRAGDTLSRMALSKEEFDLFREHLRGTCTPPFQCPMCGSKEWSVDGPMILLQYSTQMETAVINQGGMPVVVMTCKKCCNVRQFAWLPILKGEANG
jgi:hypothetical protein